MAMAKKVSFDLDKTISRISRPSIFDRLVKEIKCIQVPPRYVRSVVVNYYDGKIVEIDGTYLSKPVPMSKDADWTNLDNIFKEMKDLKVYIDVETLENDVNEEVEKLLGKYC